MSACRACGATYGGHRQHCTGCHETFAGTRPGDAHRVGPYTARRCLAADEMRAVGLWVDGGVWHGRRADDGTQHRRAAAGVFYDRADQP